VQVTVNEVPVLMSNHEKEWLDQAVVDYHDDRFRKGFSVFTGSGESCC
jgi:hypothetical protein